MTNKQFNQSVTDSIKNLVNKAKGDLGLQDAESPNESTDTGEELPLKHLREYDGAAEHFARHGELPCCMGSPGAIDYINADPEAFEQRVRDFKYAAAMEETHRRNALHNKASSARFSEWLEQTGDSIEIDDKGGNFTQDRIAANHDIYKNGNPFQ